MSEPVLESSQRGSERQAAPNSKSTSAPAARSSSRERLAGMSYDEGVAALAPHPMPVQLKKGGGDGEAKTPPADTDWKTIVMVPFNLARSSLKGGDGAAALAWLAAAQTAASEAAKALGAGSPGMGEIASALQFGLRRFPSTYRSQMTGLGRSTAGKLRYLAKPPFFADGFISAMKTALEPKIARIDKKYDVKGTLKEGKLDDDDEAQRSKGLMTKEELKEAKQDDDEAEAREQVRVLEDRLRNAKATLLNLQLLAQKKGLDEVAAKVGKAYDQVIVSLPKTSPAVEALKKHHLRASFINNLGKAFKTPVSLAAIEKDPEKVIKGLGGAFEALGDAVALLPGLPTPLKQLSRKFLYAIPGLIGDMRKLIHHRTEKALKDI